MEDNLRQRVKANLLLTSFAEDSCAPSNFFGLERLTADAAILPSAPVDEEIVLERSSITVRIAVIADG